MTEIELSWLLCKRCDVFVGYGAVGVVKEPEDRDHAWKCDHCWMCKRHRDEIRVDPR